MHAAIWLPNFHLQAAMRYHGILAEQAAALLDGDPKATRDQSTLREVNERAQKHEIQPGMTAPQAQARCARIMFLYPEPEEEERMQQELLLAAGDCTPYHELTLPGLCILDLTRVKNLEGRENECAEGLHASLVRHGLEARVGLARQPDLAMLAAQAAQPMLVLRTDAEAQAFLHHIRRQLN